MVYIYIYILWVLLWQSHYPCATTVRRIALCSAITLFTGSFGLLLTYLFIWLTDDKSPAACLSVGVRLSVFPPFLVKKHTQAHMYVCTHAHTHTHIDTHNPTKHTRTRTYTTTQIMHHVCLCVKTCPHGQRK